MWYAKQVDLGDVGSVRRLLGEDWWFRLREPSLRVVLPEPCYQVWDWESESYVWDEIGFRAYCEDLRRYPHVPTEYRRRRRVSWFLFYVEVGKSWGMKPKRAWMHARWLLERFGMGRRRLLELGVAG